MLVHGDDFVLLADEDAADAMLKLLETAYKVKEVAKDWLRFFTTGGSDSQSDC